jgi:hypothetical protein
LILFETGRIDVRQIVGEDLQLFFLSDGAGEYGIDGSIHVLCAPAALSATGVSNRHATFFVIEGLAKTDMKTL